MATRPVELNTSASPLRAWAFRLNEAAGCIESPTFDALFFWGGPVLALAFVVGWLEMAALLSKAQAISMAEVMVTGVAVLTYAHLMAVFPRAYLNRDVFRTHRLRLTIVPVVLISAMLISPTCFLVAGVVVVFWDVHHSAMQNFGLGRIYDMKAGNDVQLLRAADMRLNWILYVGPLAAGASLPTHLNFLKRFDQIGWTQLASMPGVLQGELRTVTVIAILATVAILGWVAADYARAIRNGYRMPAHKLAIILSTAGVSLAAWGFSPPVVALTTVNIYHALQYFALVWVKEGKNIHSFLRVPPKRALAILLAVCAALGVAYELATKAGIQWLLAPFLACSLLHFWFDGFVWSVRRRQV